MAVWAVLYDFDVGEEIPGHCTIEAWVPPVPAITEVFHAHIVDWAYPPHCHDTWAVLIVDDGAISYDLDTRPRGAARRTVTILPPGVVHDGRPAPGAAGFRKRELYLRAGFLPVALTGAAVDRSNIADTRLWTALAGLHDCLARDAEPLDAEERLAMAGERIAAHLTAAARPVPAPERPIARQLRLLLDEHIVAPITLEAAAAALDRSVPHLVRSFTRQFGVSPHAYVIGRRIDAARRDLLRGARPADVATAVGFCDQAHFTRHFKRHTSITPARFARGRTP
jgi:AraC-like DNA-binding protein